VNSDAVMSRGDMWDLGFCAGHVAIHTAIGDSLPGGSIGRESTGVGLVTFQALGPVDSGGFGLGEVTVRVVTGCAGQGRGLGVAAAFLELLDVSHDRHVAATSVQNVVGPVFGQPLSRAEVVESSAPQAGG
tara:strand:+ start:296 stop:688 length:393 start_codon:yes stop_codon:yes gene_type:complete